MNFLKAGGLSLLIVFLSAVAMRVFYPPVPRDIEFLAPVSGDLEAGNLIFNSRLPLFKTGWLQAVGIPDESPGTIQTVRAYVDALQRTPDKVDLVITASTAIDHAISGVQHAVMPLDRADFGGALQTLREAHARNLKVLLILASFEATHRLPKTILSYFEDQLSMKIPTVVFAGLALTEDAETFLVPSADGNPWSDKGQVYDLANNILIMSRKARVAKPRLDHYLVSIEEESDDEELVAIYRPPR